MKIKVIHLISSLQLGGVEKGINLSINELNNFFDYRVMTLTNANKFYEPNSVKYFIFLKYKFLVVSIFPSLKKLKEENPSIIISSLWKSAIVALIYKIFINRKVKLVAFVHNETYFHLADAFFNKMLLGKADAIACDSLNTLKIIKQRNSNHNNYFIIPYIFFGKEQHKINLHNLKEIRFLYAGRLNEVKNLEAVIDFFAIFMQNNKSFRLHIYGDGDNKYIKKLKEKIEKNSLNDKVLFKGIFNASETSAIYQQYHFYIQFSKNEGMAMSVVDAMINGVIPISTPVGEIKNYIQHLKNGILIKNNANEKDYLTLCIELNDIINNSNIYDNISKECYLYFRERKNYIQSFVEMINDLN